ncbi:MAG: phosphatidylserine decarboxylase [Planctomycetes bacterium]|nr:phosphatidylserine decarboxylase [Planctomycetota bacterium]MCB9917951.1 phosphatidylserine decarboxylase [Planctomycetota bacterium]
MRLRRTLLTLLPKWALSRTTGVVTRIPIPRGARAAAYRAFARRYGVDLTEVETPLTEFRSLRDFFVRRLPSTARPIAVAPLVWPCDGRIVTAGPIVEDRIPQVKGIDYGLRDLIVDDELAGRLSGGTQATVYLSPRDYHRVHAPFTGRCTSSRHVPGSLFPVNPEAQRSIPQLFARNERVVFAFELGDGQRAAVVLVAALNVGDIVCDHALPKHFEVGEELAYFGFGSTTIVVLGPGPLTIPELSPGSAVRMGACLRGGDTPPE